MHAYIYIYTFLKSIITVGITIKRSLEETTFNFDRDKYRRMIHLTNPGLFRKTNYFILQVLLFLVLFIYYI